MTNATNVLRSLITYAVCVPLAVFIGYLLANPLNYSTLAIFGIIVLILSFPLVVRWHYGLFLLSWSMPTVLVFLKGQPHLWLVMGVMTLGIALLERTLSREKYFIHVPQIMWPLLCLIGVVLLTAKLTGGFGLRALGSEVYGGKKYVFLMAGILGYFALVSRRIPKEKAGLCVGLFFIGGVMNFVGDLYPIAPSWMEFVFWFFPPTRYDPNGFEWGVTRLGGAVATGVAIYSLLVAQYGIRGIFFSGRLWRPVVFFLSCSLIFLGGFRSSLVYVGATFCLQFYLEKCHKTRLLPAFILGGLLGIALLIPLAPKLPYTFQRTLAFVPGLKLDLAAEIDAAASSEWRKNMWKALLPQIPQYFFLGKGYAISMEDYQMMGYDSAFRTVDESQQALALSGDYHNGPLSVIIPFGIWGMVLFMWLLFAGLNVMYCNYKYGDPDLSTFNTFLFATYIVSMVMFIFVAGALSSDVARFIGPVGLSVCLNGGVRRAANRPVPANETSEPSEFLPQPRPSFQR